MRNLNGIPFRINTWKLRCDNPACKYIDSINPENYRDYLNTYCPRCNENLLTEEDLKKTEIILNIISAVNNFFAFFGFKKFNSGSKVSINVHKKIKIKITRQDNPSRK